MRIIFAGRDNAFNRKIVQEFSTEHEVLCCLLLEPERVSRKGKRKKIWVRIKKYGLIKVLDQLAFHLFDRLFLRKLEPNFWKMRPEYCNPAIKLNCPEYKVDNINDLDWVTLCKKLNPDIILATCSQVIFKPELFLIPSLGTYIIHEGLTPEYKGLYTPLWALMKKEFQYIGYTVLKANEKIDGGEILLQSTYTMQKGENFRSWSWIGHNAIISGLEEIKTCFRELEKNGNFVPLARTNRKSGYYTWMRLSGFIWLYFKNYWSILPSKQYIKAKQAKHRPMRSTIQSAELDKA